MIAERTVSVTLALLRSAVLGVTLTEKEKADFREETLADLLSLSKKHDLSHLLAYGLKQNGLEKEAGAGVDRAIFQAAFRYERLNYELERLVAALEAAKIPFIPLKGSVLRAYYPEPWMRTSCDIDVLVHGEDLERGIDAIVSSLGYELKERGSHDVSLFSSDGMTHVELHYDLVEEGRAKEANPLLATVWDHVSLKDSYGYFYEMSDAFFYFYHVVHMAKHFTVGGCGVRPFIDLWILDHMEGADTEGRMALLEQAELLSFADSARKLSGVWFGGEEKDELCRQLEHFVLVGGVYGTTENRVALQQGRQGGRIGYIIHRLFLPYELLKRFYPVLEKHRWLTPLMQVRRWFRLLKPSSAKRAKNELDASRRMEQSEAESTARFLSDIGL